MRASASEGEILPQFADSWFRDLVPVEELEIRRVLSGD